jgi:hypothetical protein
MDSKVKSLLPQPGAEQQSFCRSIRRSVPNLRTLRYSKTWFVYCELTYDPDFIVLLNTLITCGQSITAAPKCRAFRPTNGILLYETNDPLIFNQQ